MNPADGNLGMDRPISRKDLLLGSSYSRTITALFWLLVAQAESSPFPSEAPMNAIELLTAFSGESAMQYEEVFRFSEEARIVGFEIHAVGTENTTARYSGREKAWKEVNN